MIPARPTLVLAAITAMIAAGLMIFFYAPQEALQGEVQRIFYVHAPSAWLGYLAFAVVALAGIKFLANRDLFWDTVAASAGELGMVFTTVVLITGPIWGRRVWGVWWVWDARLTSTLILWIIYAGYLIHRGLTPPGPSRARVSAVVGIVGAIDIPIIHFAVVWWRTLHPLPAVISPDGPQLPGSMLTTLLVSVAAFTLFFAALLRFRISQRGQSARLDRALAHV